MPSEEHPDAENGTEWKPSQEFYGEEYFSGKKGKGESGYDDAAVAQMVQLQHLFLSGFESCLQFDSVLDVGCARGALMEAASRLGKKSFGTDYSFYALKEPLAASLRGRAVQADAVDLPFASKSFDLVVCQEVLEHIAPDLVGKAMRELRRVSKALVVVTVPTWYKDCSALPLSYEEIPKDEKGTPIHGHICLASGWWWEKRLNEEGLVVCSEIGHAVRRRWGAGGRGWVPIVCRTRDSYPDEESCASAYARAERSYEDRMNAQRRRVAEGVLGEAGTPTRRALGTWIRMTEDDAPGWLLLGPNEDLEPGAYAVTFAIKRLSEGPLPQTCTPPLTMDVMCSLPWKRVSDMDVGFADLPRVGRTAYYTLPFLSQGEGSFNYRAWYSGGPAIEIRSLRKARPLPRHLLRRIASRLMRLVGVLQFERGTHLLLPDGYASGATHVELSGGIILSSTPRGGPRYLLYGPYAELAPGKYRVAFRLEVGKIRGKLAAGTPLVTLDVVSGPGETWRAERTIGAGEGCLGRVEPALEFESKGETATQFRILTHGHSRVSVVFPPAVEMLRR